MENDNLKSILSELRALKAHLMDQDGYYLESEWIDSDKTLCVTGNKTGLIALAINILYLCSKNVDENHFHLDEQAGLPEGSPSVIVFLER
jgi:hypothetical protein